MPVLQGVQPIMYAESGGRSRRLLGEGDIRQDDRIVSDSDRGWAIRFAVAIRYDSDPLEVEGEVGFALADHAIPIPRFLWLVLDDEMTVAFRVVAGEGPNPGGPEQERDR